MADAPPRPQRSPRPRNRKPTRPHRPSTRQAIPLKSERGLSDAVRIDICRYLLQNLNAKGIAKQVNCSERAVYNVKQNLMKYGNVRAPPQTALGARVKISDEDSEALYEALVANGWMAQRRMRDWLLTERGIEVSQSTISRFLEDKGWTQGTLKDASPRQREGESRDVAEGQDGVSVDVTAGSNVLDQSFPNTSPTASTAPTAPLAYISPYPPLPSPSAMRTMQQNDHSSLLLHSQPDDEAFTPNFGLSCWVD